MTKQPPTTTTKLDGRRAARKRTHQLNAPRTAANDAPQTKQAIPGLSPVPWWGTLFPLAVVLTVNGVKEGFDDYWRHVSDAQVNRR